MQGNQDENGGVIIKKFIIIFKLIYTLFEYFALFLILVKLTGIYPTILYINIVIISLLIIIRPLPNLYLFTLC